MNRAGPRASRHRRLRVPGKLPALLAGLLALTGCEGGGDGGPAPARDCAALSDSLFPDTSRTSFAVFKVVAPNGGTFRVGSEMKVVVAGADYSNALIDLVVAGNGIDIARIPGFPPANGIDPREQCEFAFAVPETVTTLSGKRISLVSDSVKVRISDYSDALSFDYSDSVLAIVR